MSNPNPNEAIAIKVNDRFFCKYKNKRISTAWSLAGAQLFGAWETIEIAKIVSIIVKKKYEFTLVNVSIK